MNSDRIKDTGIYSKDGNNAGIEATMYALEREKGFKEYEKKRKEIQERYTSAFNSLQDGFVEDKEYGKDQISKYTYGLHTLQDYKNIHKIIEKDQEAKRNQQKEKSEKLIKEARQKLDSKRKANAKLLSFNEEEDDDDIIPITHYKPKRRNLNEDSATNEKEKETTDDKAISKCVDEWKEKQEEIKKEKISIHYNFFDGKNHMEDITVERGDTIQFFLDQVRRNIQKKYPQYYTLTTDDLMYVKENAIIPTNYTFYKLYVTKATYKSIPLYIYKTSSEEVLSNDEKNTQNEIHVDKVVDKRWYSKNKHVYPYNKWEKFSLTEEQEK